MSDFDPVVGIDEGRSTAGIDLVGVLPPTALSVLKTTVLLALPWGKMTHPITAFSVAQLMDRRRSTTSALNFGDAFVAHSRNSIADFFLKSTCEYLLMLDDDMAVPFGDAKWYRAHTGWEKYPDPFASFNTITRLLSHGKTLVGGLYKGRWEKANFVYGEGNLASEKEYMEKGPYNLIKETKWCGTGCLLAHRSVFESIEKKFPLLARGPDGRGGQFFTSSEHGLADAVSRARKMLGDSSPMDGNKAMRAYEILVAAESEAKASSNLGIGEDVVFCKRARASGHSVFVDAGLRIGHIGHKVY